jgi:hypothetical protein
MTDTKPVLPLEGVTVVSLEHAIAGAGLSCASRTLS